MITWSSVISDRMAAAAKATVIVGATAVGATSDVRSSLALASAQAFAILLGRLIQRPPWLEALLSIGALFVAPFQPAFIAVTLIVIVVYLDNHTRVFGSTPTDSRDVMTKLLDLTHEGGLDPVVICRALVSEVMRITGSKGVAVIVNSRTLADAGQITTIDATYPLPLGEGESGHVAISGGQLTIPAVSIIAEAGARLEAALLFSEARSSASAAERSRMARDMHDGVAQELTSLGYLIDDMLAEAPEQVRAGLRSLRNELTRVISELRLSIFELRSSTSETLTIGAALSDYVNQVRSNMPFRIHLHIDEGSERLSEEVEGQLLRIIQESLANARRHSQAENVWISCQIRAPRALITVEDDGVGLKDARTDSFGLGIMKERASQIGAQLTVSNRMPTGVDVSIELGD